jgi:hypothetical protein
MHKRTDVRILMTQLVFLIIGRHEQRTEGKLAINMCYELEFSKCQAEVTLTTVCVESSNGSSNWLSLAFA